jgi:hypothetical protein
MPSLIAASSLALAFLLKRTTLAIKLTDNQSRITYPFFPFFPLPPPFPLPFFGMVHSTKKTSQIKIQLSKVPRHFH